ncbi:MAG TPA: hypothetical protein VFN10_15060 [Thermoanaerobaculia bacterium]|nr:hypothetical protein [Thermoanaerobaculia bacterium]
MANLFPDIYPNEWLPEYERFQERDKAKNGFLQINSYDPVNQFFAKATWNTLTRTQYDQIEDHWFSYAASAFHIYDFFLHKVRGVYVATADGVATIYTLPAKAVVSRTVKHNTVTAAAQPTLLVGTGAEGEDQIQYTTTSKPAAGVVITLDATDARRKFECNYADVRFRGRHREADVWIVEAELIQKVVA